MDPSGAAHLGGALRGRHRGAGHHHPGRRLHRALRRVAWGLVFGRCFNDGVFGGQRMRNLLNRQVVYVVNLVSLCCFPGFC